MVVMVSPLVHLQLSDTNTVTKFVNDGKGKTHPRQNNLIIGVPDFYMHANSRGHRHVIFYILIVRLHFIVP